jgi:hypothetical protein
VKELEAAETLASERADIRAKALAATERKKSVIAATAAREKLVTKADHVDAALVALDVAQEELRLAGLDWTAAARKAGAGDGGRMANGLLAATRWASYFSAPTYSADAQIPRVEMNRRKSLAASVASLAPVIAFGNENV